MFDPDDVKKASGKQPYWVKVRGVDLPTDPEHWFWLAGEHNRAGVKGKHPTFRTATVNDACVFLEIVREELLALPKDADPNGLFVGLYLFNPDFRTDAFTLKRGVFHQRTLFRQAGETRVGRDLSLAYDIEDITMGNLEDADGMSPEKIKEKLDDARWNSKNALLEARWKPCATSSTASAATSASRTASPSSGIDFRRRPCRI